MTSTYITIAEFFIIRPHGPKFCTGQGAFKDLVRLQQTQKESHEIRVKTRPSFRFGERDGDCTVELEVSDASQDGPALPCARPRWTTR